MSQFIYVGYLLVLYVKFSVNVSFFSKNDTFLYIAIFSMFLATIVVTIGKSQISTRLLHLDLLF